MTPDRFVDDRRRQNAVVNLHWTVLRFTWHDLVDRPDGVVSEIRTALSAHRSPRPPGGKGRIWPTGGTESRRG
jgi:very-short-patch-repair endonuclease